MFRLPLLQTTATCLVLITPCVVSAQTAFIRGEVTSTRGSHPVAGAVISVVGGGVAVGDSKGHFVLESPPSGKATVMVLAPGYVTSRIEIDFGLGTELHLSLDPVAGSSSGDVIVVEGKAEYSDPVVQVVSVEEMQAIPGSFGDAIRAVQNLPGVARPAFGTGALIVRGTEPEDTGVYVDGIRVPQLFHFGALTTVINSDMLDEVRFLPGGYGVRFGRNLGGVVDVQTNTQTMPRFTAYADIDLLDGTAFFASPTGQYGGISGSVRRSYIDLVLEPFLSLEAGGGGPPGSGGGGGPGGGGSASFQLPVYDDYQLVYDTAIGDNHRIHAMVFGARDSFILSGGDDEVDEGETAQDDTSGLSITNTKGLLRWTFTPTARLTNNMTVALGPDTNEFSVGALELTNNPMSYFLRDDLYLDLSDRIHLRGGLDAVVQDYEFSLEAGTQLTSTSGDPLTEEEDVALSGSPVAFSAAPWLEADLITRDVTFTPGLRVDGHLVRDPDQVEPLSARAVSVDPRLAIRWRVSPGTSLKASFGRYSNGVDPFIIYPDFNPDGDLTVEYALQSTLGLDHRFTPWLSLQGSLYQGELRDLLVGGGPRQPDLTPGGAGSNYGLEALLRAEPTDSGFFGWVSYTLQYGIRNDDFANACPRFSEGEDSCSEWYLFDNDQTHILTLVASQRLPLGFEVGARFRYTTGNPYTPVVSADYDVDADIYVPTTGDINSERLPAFHQLDLKISKRWEPTWGELSTGLEILNVYNRDNPEYLLYNFDYTETDYVQGIPFFPSVGIKAKF